MLNLRRRGSAGGRDGSVFRQAGGAGGSRAAPARARRAGVSECLAAVVVSVHEEKLEGPRGGAGHRGSGGSGVLPARAPGSRGRRGRRARRSAPRRLALPGRAAGAGGSADRRGRADGSLEPSRPRTLLQQPFLPLSEETRAKPGSADRLTALAARCVALGARPYFCVLTFAPRARLLGERRPRKRQAELEMAEDQAIFGREG